jgi:dTDP-4-amino-4,6-dideoxy-D-galactose acyltransferase
MMPGQQTMNFECKLLPWDSGFFGFKIASITPNRLSPARLGQILESLRQQDVSLVYWPSDPVDEESQNAAITFEGFLADRKTIYSINLKNSFDVQATVKTNIIEEYTGTVACPELVGLAFESGIFSRFKLDQHFSQEKYEELYKIWISRSVDKAIADAVFVARNNGRIVAMVTVSSRDEIGVIGLIAVEEGMRGNNVGKDLIATAHTWYIARGCTIGRVTTQGINHVACKLYERCGYTVERIHNYYHFWLKSA